MTTRGCPCQIGRVITDSKAKAALLNAQFASVFSKLTERHPPRITWNHPVMSDFIITTAGVEKLLNNLNVHKAPGPDELTPQLLKTVAHEVAPALQFIFRLSLDQGEIPDDWRHARVAPIYKKGDPAKPENYRPVSLTSVPCKVMEHILASQINRHLKKHNLLTNSQHGFRQRRSCETQLIATTRDFINSIEEKGQCDIILLDFSKAFDKVSHQLLLTKLKHFGIQQTTHKWISSFLSGRTQEVVVEGASSEKCRVTSGVPQGSVLGPLLFLLFINDLPAYAKHSQIRLFADDCMLYREVTETEDCDLLQQDLTNLMTWAEDWNMQFHPQKCLHLTASLKKKQIASKYYMGNHQLQKTDSARYLGVTFTSKMSWTSHINNIASKAHGKLAFLQRNIGHCPRHIKNLGISPL